MKNKTADYLKKQWALILSFFIPLLIMLVIHAFKGVYPFGDSSLLTIDLGQQYIDFFSYYRETLLHDPGSLFYSFAKSIGGDMISLWAYYLTSPLNLIFLLLPQSQLSLGVTIITLLKYSLSGLSMAYFLKKAFNGEGLLLVSFAISYALMGYTVVNQFNIMWLDGIILLPLVALGIEYLVFLKRGRFYTLALALALFANYYIGYMICLFIVLYYFYRLTGLKFPDSFTTKNKIKALFKSMVLFVWHSLLAGGLTAFLLLPTLMALINSKVAYMKADLNWTLDYSIPKLISKFMIGAFNFDQMPSGYPNVFIGSLALLSFFLFFFNHSFPKKERLSAFIITSFFVLSMNIKALNKIWHAMQFPNWYPYRFSFVVCFFLIVLGFRNFKRFKGLTPLRTFFAIILWAAAGLYTYQQKFDFIEPFQIILTLLFVMIIILLLILKNNQYAWLPLAFFLVTAAEMSTNAALSLSRLSYVDQNSFSIYQLSMQDIRDQIRTTDEQFYRIEKTFLRSKNDSLQADFQSITHFSSTFESSIPELFGKLGFPQGSGFLTYSNGTLITDAFFGVKYYLSEQSNTYELPTETLSDYVLNQSIPLDKEVFTSSILNRSQVLHHLSEPDNEKENFSLTLLQTKPDLRKYQKLSATPKVILYQNPFALPIAFGSSDDILTVDEESNPIRMQEAILNGLLGKTDEEDYFSRLPFDNVFYVNTSTIEDAAFQQVERDDTSDEASITFQFTPQTDDAYYMTMGSSVKDKDISLFLNNKPFTQYDNYNDTLILNLANQNKYETIAFKMKLEDEPVSLEDIQLYQLNQSSFEQSVKDLKAGGMIVDEYSNTSLKGTVTILPEQSFLMTTIPYSEGWSVNVDGVPVTPVKALDSLLAVPVKEGKHTVVFSYRNLYLNQGILLSFISLAFLFLPAYLKNLKKSYSFK